MHSYVKIHHFEPRTDYRPIESLMPLIEQTMSEKQVSSQLNEGEVLNFKANLIHCLQTYYQLVGIDEAVIAGRGTVKPCGTLPRYAESLIRYFQELGWQTPANKEITILEYSGVSTIKIRYKYTDSIIKKLVKLGLRDPKLLQEPLKLFLRGGALHDLIGILFICSYPYEKEWVARSLYNFFEYDHRTDDHLQYGFYTVEKESGYQGLHCDHTLFNPRFDTEVSQYPNAVINDPRSIFSLLEAKDGYLDVLRKLKDYFNIEIQLHTTFENLWATMEHKNNYNVQAKGIGRSKEITVQWKMLSSTMKKLELQFEKLQIDTEQVKYKAARQPGYVFAQELFNELGSDALNRFVDFRMRMRDLEELLSSHEISRQDYVRQMREEADRIDAFALQQPDLTIQIIFKMQSAFVYFGLADHRQFFNSYDIRKFVQIAQERYREINTFLQKYPQIYKANLLNIIAILRYLQLGQRFGLGLINPNEEILSDEAIPTAIYARSLSLFETGISMLNHLDEQDLHYFKEDNAAYLEIIQRYDILSRDWELFNHPDDSEQSAGIAQSIASFKARFIIPSLLDQFNNLLKTDKIKHVGFVVKFYTTLVWHGIVLPLYTLKQIVKYSAYDRIKASDLFYYELAAYRFLVVLRCETLEDCAKNPPSRNTDENRIKHYKNYHRENMIQLLFRIKRNEPSYTFHKARLHFETMTESIFKIDHFSDTLDP